MFGMPYFVTGPFSTTELYLHLKVLEPTTVHQFARAISFGYRAKFLSVQILLFSSVPAVNPASSPEQR